MNDYRPYKVCVKLIQKNIHDRDKLNTIAFFYKLKYHYSNSKIYNPTPRKIAEKIKMSAYLTNKLVGIIIEMGLGEIVQQKNKRDKIYIPVLQLKSINKIKVANREFYKEKINIHGGESLKELSMLLKSCCVGRYLRQQKYVLDCKSDQVFLDYGPEEEVKFMPLKRIRRIKKVVRNHGEEITGLISFTARKAFSKFHINFGDYSTFKKITESLLGWQWVASEKIIEVCPYEEYLWGREKSRFNHCFWYKGKYITITPSGVVL